jgi:large subunit ribosomal protein L25
MAEALVLKAQIRDGSGSKKSTALRQKGMIPAVVYGHKEKPVSIAVSGRDFLVNLHHGSRLFDVEIAGKQEKLLIKEVQYDYLGKDVIHADFMRVDLTEKIKISVPIEIKGTAKGAADGGIVDQHLAQLEVECVVTSIPDAIVISIKELGVGDSIHAADIKLPAGVTLVTDPAAIVLACHVVVEAKTTEEADLEAPVTPEVIGKAKKEEGEEGEEAKA